MKIGDKVIVNTSAVNLKYSQKEDVYVYPNGEVLLGKIYTIEGFCVVKPYNDILGLILAGKPAIAKEGTINAGENVGWDSRLFTLINS